MRKEAAHVGAGEHKLNLTNDVLKAKYNRCKTKVAVGLLDRKVPYVTESPVSVVGLLHLSEKDNTWLLKHRYEDGICTR